MGRIARRILLPVRGIAHVTTRGVDGMLVFLDDDDRRHFLSLLAYVARSHLWDIHAFCLMGNHYHLVVEATLEDLSDGLRLLNGAYAREFNARHGRRGHLWGDRYWSEPIEDDAQLAATIAYVLENPVRAGLCDGPDDWAWSGISSRRGAGGGARGAGRARHGRRAWDRREHRARAGLGGNARRGIGPPARPGGGGWRPGWGARPPPPPLRA